MYGGEGGSYRGRGLCSRAWSVGKGKNSLICPDLTRLVSSYRVLCTKPSQHLADGQETEDGYSKWALCFESTPSFATDGFSNTNTILENYYSTTVKLVSEPHMSLPLISKSSSALSPHNQALLLYRSTVQKS